MKPYYQHGGITIYHGDCREILPSLQRADLLLTDTPYGVGFNYKSHDDTLEAWKNLITFTVQWAKSSGTPAIMPSCQINQMEWIYKTIPPDWLLCWYKGSPGHAGYVGFNDWEPLLVYGKRKGLQMHDYFFVSPDSFTNGHPCPKPIKWATWLISRTTVESELVLDPFMGSGTTLRAAKDLGRQAIGIDIEEKYCEIAANRMAQDVLL